MCLTGLCASVRFAQAFPRKPQCAERARALNLSLRLNIARGRAGRACVISIGERRCSAPAKALDTDDLRQGETGR